MTAKKQSSAIQRFAQRLADKAAQRQEVLDKRFADVTECERDETPAEREERIINDPAAWDKV